METGGCWSQTQPYSKNYPPVIPPWNGGKEEKIPAVRGLTARRNGGKGKGEPEWTRLFILYSVRDLPQVEDFGGFDKAGTLKADNVETGGAGGRPGPIVSAGGEAG